MRNPRVHFKDGSSEGATSSSWLKWTLGFLLFLLIFVLFALVMLFYRLTVLTNDEDLLSRLDRASESPTSSSGLRLRREHSKFIAGLEPWNNKIFGHEDFAAFKAPPLESSQEPPRVLVVYTYADAPWRERNLRYFLQHGVIPRISDGTSVDYTFVLHGVGTPPLHIFREHGIPYEVMVVTENRRRDVEGEVLSWGQDIANMPLVRIIVRDNVGYDFCASRMVLLNGWAAKAGTYTRFILMNASVRGPFLPTYALPALTWIDAFLDQLHGNVHMSGTTVNCLSSQRSGDTGEFKALHLQSMVLGMDLDGLRAIAPYLQCYSTMIEAISYGEVGFTQAVLAAGHAVAALQGNWNGFQITKKSLTGSEVARRCAAVSDDSGGDPSIPGVYLNGDIHPLEVLFIKTNRNFNEDFIERWTLMKDSYGISR